jgi:hypothetical protein
MIPCLLFAATAWLPSVTGGRAKHVIAVARMTTNTVCGAGPEKGRLQVGGAAVVCKCW